jgi:hypothetical protein
LAQAEGDHLPEFGHVLLDPQRLGATQWHGRFMNTDFVSAAIKGHGFHDRGSGIHTDQAISVIHRTCSSLLSRRALFKSRIANPLEFLVRPRELEPT